MQAKKKTASMPVAGMELLRRRLATADRAVQAIERLADDLGRSGDLLDELQVWQLMDVLESNVALARDRILMMSSS